MSTAVTNMIFSKGGMKVIASIDKARGMPIKELIDTKLSIHLRVCVASVNNRPIPV